MAIGKPILEGSSQGQKRSTTQILTLSDPKIRGQEPKTLSKRAHNPLLKEAGLTKPTAAHPSGGPVAGGAIGTSGMPLTASGRERPPDSDACKQRKKLGVIEASYASAIIGVLSPVSSHCLTTAKIWVAGGGAGGDVPDALASALGLPYGQPQPPKHPCPS